MSENQKYSSLYSRPVHWIALYSLAGENIRIKHKHWVRSLIEVVLAILLVITDFAVILIWIIESTFEGGTVSF